MRKNNGFALSFSAGGKNLNEKSEVIVLHYKGVVKDNVIILESGVKLPDGTSVEITPKGQISETKLSHKQSIRGKYAFVRTSSEDFAKRKQQEIDTEVKYNDGKP